MGDNVVKCIHLDFVVFFVLTFFISGFTPEVLATQTGLPVSEILIEMDWNL